MHTPPDESAGQAPVATPAPPPTARRHTTRRVFLGGAILAAGAGAVAYIGDLFAFRRYVRWYSRAAENYGRAYTNIHLPPAKRLVEHFDYLTLDAYGVRRFVADYEKEFGAVTPGAVGANRLFYTKYLMSSDFFLNGADESRPVKYVALHSPYVNPCWTPFPPSDASA